MSIIQNNGACPALLVGIGEVLKESAPQNLVTPVGAIQALYDPDNRRPVTMEQIGGGSDGHTKQVRIMYRQRSTPDEVRTSKSCNPGTEKPTFEDTFSVNQYRGITIHKTEQTIRDLCAAYSEFVRLGGATTDSSRVPLQVMRDFANDILLDIDPLRQSINQAILTSTALNIGGFADDQSSPLTVKVLKSADDHSVNSAGFNIMRQNLNKLGYSGTPIFFGGGLMDYAIMSLGYGCCNDGGTDFSKLVNQLNLKFYKDYNDFSDYFTSVNSVIGFMPGTLQFVPFNRYVGNFARPIGVKQRGTMPDPAIPGLSYDISITPNECEEFYDVVVELYFDLYAAPTTMFKTGDRLEGVNGVLEFVASTVS